MPNNIGRLASKNQLRGGTRNHIINQDSTFRTGEEFMTRPNQNDYKYAKDTPTKGGSVVPRENYLEYLKTINSTNPKMAGAVAGTG